MSEQSANSDSDEAINGDWLSAVEAYRLIVAATWAPGANIAIAQRAHAGLLRSKAIMLIVDQTSTADAEIPKQFWWADGYEALTQNWKTGDFETWIDSRIHCRALGVQFHLGDLKKSFPDVFKSDSVAVAPSEASIAKGGRPPAEWWDDLWIEMCRALYVGDLKPQRQADIEKAMNEWIASKSESAASSTVRSRARKLWQALSREGEN